MKMKRYLSFWVLFLLIGCIQHSPQLMTDGAVVPSMAPEGTAMISGPPFPPLSTVMPASSPTLIFTPTREISTAIFTPTSTQAPSLFQEIQKLPKGSYILLSGRNDNKSDYAYVIITDTGKIIKKFELSEHVLGFSNDLHYFVYEEDFPNISKLADTNDRSISYPLINECTHPTWSKDNTLLSMLCGDGIHFFELKNGIWSEKVAVDRPDELDYLPDDFIFLKYPIWMQNGFAFFIDYSSFTITSGHNFPQRLYLFRKECIDNSQKCDLRKPVMDIDDGSPPITAVAMSSDDRLLAIVVSNDTVRELRIYDFLSQTVVQRFDLIKLEQNNRRSTVDSLVWVEHDKRLLFSMTDPSRIVDIDLSNEKSEVLLNCSDHQVFDCSILSTVTIH